MNDDVRLWSVAYVNTQEKPGYNVLHSFHQYASSKDECLGKLFNDPNVTPPEQPKHVIIHEVTVEMIRPLFSDDDPLLALAEAAVESKENDNG